MSPIEDKQFSLSRLSIRRKSNQINLSVLLVLILAVVSTIAIQVSLNGVEGALRSDMDGLPQSQEAAISVDEAMAETIRAISGARTLSLVLGLVGVAMILFLGYRLITVGLRSVALEVWIRRMGAGDLDYKTDVGGQDEITELGIALEELRQRSIRAMQLNLVEKLSKDLQGKNDELEGVLNELRQTQDQIITQQKLAELGELTAGVAHEIRNPLNFVKNFSEASEELLDELRETLEEQAAEMDTESRELVADISHDLTENMERIRSHTERANRIVRDMLMMGRGGGNYEMVDINILLRERAALAFHSARAMNPEFQLDIREELDPNAGEVSMISENMGRVFLNIVGNACYAMEEKGRTLDDGQESYAPTLWLRTERFDDKVEIRIRDNGGGIPPDVIEKIFNPFFTTKPSDKGTGLGLSLSNDIVREHGGSITPVSSPGEYTEMIISIPVSGDDGQERLSPQG